eukprot:COSAG04_NODE_5316_length_1660_cov_1.628443_1_plen_204_part_00
MPAGQIFYGSKDLLEREKNRRKKTKKGCRGDAGGSHAMIRMIMIKPGWGRRIGRWCSKVLLKSCGVPTSHKQDIKLCGRWSARGGRRPWLPGGARCPAPSSSRPTSPQSPPSSSGAPGALLCPAEPLHSAPPSHTRRAIPGPPTAPPPDPPSPPARTEPPSPRPTPGTPRRACSGCGSRTTRSTSRSWSARPSARARRRSGSR